MNLQKYIKNENGLFLLITIFIVLFVRLRLLDIPFERDEGEYAYAGQAILKGLLPYRDFYNMKMPNVYFGFALIIKYLGHHAIAIRLVTMCVNFANAGLIYCIAKTRFKSDESIIATSVYLLLSLTYEAQGWVSNSEHFVLLPALLGIYALSLFEKFNNLKQNILLAVAGTFLMAAFLTKQHAFGYLLFAGLWIGFISLEKSAKWVSFQSLRLLMIRYCFFGIGCLLPILVLSAYLYTNDIFEPFYFLTFKYAAAYASVISPPWKYLSNFRPIFGNSVVHWLLFFVTMGTLLSSKWVKKWVENDQESLFLRVYLLLFWVCTFMCVWPGGYFRPHYFQLMFPASAIVIGLGIARCTVFWTKIGQKSDLTPLKLQGIGLCAFIMAQFGYLFTWPPDKIVLKMYDSSFKEMKDIGLMLPNLTQPTDKIAILGSEPQIFFYANRMAATGFLYHFPLIEPQKYAEMMSKQFTQETEKSKPSIFIYNHQLTFDGYNELTYNYLQVWKKEFCKDYEMIGKVYRDLSKPYSPSNLRWKHLNQDISSDSLVMIEIFKRK